MKTIETELRKFVKYMENDEVLPKEKEKYYIKLCKAFGLSKLHICPNCNNSNPSNLNPKVNLSLHNFYGRKYKFSCSSCKMLLEFDWVDLGLYFNKSKFSFSDIIPMYIVERWYNEYY